MRRIVAPFLAILLLSLLPRPVVAHPGRLDARGCHKVWQDWKSQDGKRAYKAGTRHCHRVSDEVRLGEDTILVDESPEKLQMGRDRAKDRRQ